MNAVRQFAASLLLALVTDAPAVQPPVPLQAPLEAAADWLGEWTRETDSGESLRVEYRAVLGGHFVEAWHKDARTGELRAHSMIAAGADDGRLTEYRFDDSGRLSVVGIESDQGPTGRRAADTLDVASSSTLDESLGMLEPFLGQWEVAADWPGGGVLWAQMTNRAELGGRVICSRVLAAEQGESPYDRYRTFYIRDESGVLREISFTYRGKVVDEAFAVEQNRGDTVLTSTFRPGTIGSIGIRKRLVIDSGRRMHWTDDFQSDDGKGWERVIEVDWIRTGPADPTRRSMPVEDTLFAASGSEVRPVSVERVVHAPPEDIWKAWTTEAGWKAAYAPDRPEVRANIELVPGGKYEWLFDGVLGCNGCQVLSYLPQRMLTVTWNAPIVQTRTRVWHTWIVIEIEPQEGGKSLLRTTHLGFGNGPDWDETRDYFAGAWGYVLEQMAQNLADNSGAKD